MAKKNEHKSKAGGRTMPTRENLYARVANHVPDAIDKAVALLESNNEAIRLGAIKFLVDKALPDLKAVEVTGDDHGPLQIKIIEERLVDAKNNE
jgi:hypothetical protein